MIRPGLAALLAITSVFPMLRASEPTIRFSSLKAKVVYGQREIPYEYTRRESKDASQLRIVNQRTALPTPPYNLIDLKTGEVTILYPQNSTFVRVPADRFERKQPAAPGIPGMPALPPGIGPRGTPGPAPTPSPSPPRGDNEIRRSLPLPEGFKLPEGVKIPPGIGPQSHPGGGNAPAGGPAITLPEGVELPPGVGPGATPNPGGGNAPAIPGLPPGITIPGAPPMPAMPPPGFPGAAQPPRKLVQTDRTREIHGRKCTLYTLTHPEDGTLELWTTGQLGPFYLHASGPPERGHREEFLESWPALLREAGLFPFLAVLKIGEQEAYRFEVTAIVTDPAAARDDPFPVPPRFHESELLDF